MHFFLASSALAFRHVALPVAILHSSVASRVVAGVLVRDVLGSAEVFGDGCVAAVSTMVGGHGEDLFMRASSSSWVGVVVWCEYIRL
jgi:hypothetical protein